jgi:hypothetical protein
MIFAVTMAAAADGPYESYGEIIKEVCISA